MYCVFYCGWWSWAPKGLWTVNFSTKSPAASWVVIILFENIAAHAGWWRPGARPCTVYSTLCDYHSTTPLTCLDSTGISTSASRAAKEPIFIVFLHRQFDIPHQQTLGPSKTSACQLETPPHYLRYHCTFILFRSIKATPMSYHRNNQKSMA